jgi:hypothetical protein
MITGVLLLTLGAVKVPVLEMAPAVVDHATAVFEVPVILALNCWVSCETTVALLGETVIRGLGLPEDAGVTLTVAVARTLPSVALVAVTITGVLLLTLGAVKVPLLEIAPAVVDHATTVFEVPVILALNCWVSCETTVVVLGETVMRGLGLPFELSGMTTIVAATVARSGRAESVTDSVKT